MSGRLFTVKERTLMVVNITEANGASHSEVGGVMVVVMVGDKSWRVNKI